MKKPNHDGYLAATNHVGGSAMYLTYTGDNPMQTQVAEFMTVIGQTTADTPQFAAFDSCRSLIAEEYEEWRIASMSEDFPEAIDALADMLYVIIGTFQSFGVDAQTVFNEVHRANMLKLIGPKREDGKQLKPEGWTPPDIAGILRAAGWKEE